MGLNDTITSCLSHYCSRVIVFPRISSRSTHCIITPSDHGDEYCTKIFPIQTGKVYFKISVTTVYFTKPFHLCFHSLSIVFYHGCMNLIHLNIYVLDMSCISFFFVKLDLYLTQEATAVVTAMLS